MKRKYDTHDQWIETELKDPKFAIAYLNEHWSYSGPHRLELFLEALHKVVLAQGVTKVSKMSGVSRRSLHKVLSKSGNPTLFTLLTVLDALGMRISFQSDPMSKKSHKKIRFAA